MSWAEITVATPGSGLSVENRGAVLSDGGVRCMIADQVPELARKKCAY